ncbi:hypothetical protein BGZ70_007203 [Mortierella alpina]|uniref:Cleavage/polyadenylation specificity factor A subunit N-terminal domain-containing protein n=1 Tax=Mortierella alpina TaxID=64518 RepID=A0A9P6M6W1_MORAP|nr:hypothetical protein BGZ70_007203 [Mortierella alpina]
MQRQVSESATPGAEQETLLSTDYVLYSSDQGDGGILAIKEEEVDGGIELFAITELQNSSPVLDFCVQEPTLPGRDSLYLCSGLKQEGSLKRVRSGILAESSGSGGNQFFAGATGLWNVKENRDDAFDSFLVVSFVQSTTLMRTGDGGSLEDISTNCGLDLTQATVSAGRLKDGMLFQAHRTGVIAVDPRQAQAGRESVAIPHAICMLKSQEEQYKMLVGLRDGSVSQACSFESEQEEQVSRPSYIFIVDHHDMQLVTVDEMRKYNYQTMALGLTPRRILDITCKRLLLIACVGDGFPFASSTLLLIDPQRASSEPGLETQHIVAEFSLKQGEAVYCLVEWRIPRPNRSDAVYICVGTGLFSPTGSEVSAATPKTGRLVVLSVKQSKKADRKARKFEMDLRWAMSMPAPVFAISPYMNMKLLISNGPVLKLLALDLERKTARAARIVSDCIALSPEFAVGIDMSGGIFGLGYSRNDPNCQHSLVDRFSFHMGEVANRIRLAKVWPADERSLAGISLSQQQLDQDHEMRKARTWTSSQLLGQGSSLNPNAREPTPPSSGALASWILLPWTTYDHALLSTHNPAPSQLTQSLASGRVSSQALIACTLTGSILGFWRLKPAVYQILSSLQSTLQDSYECRPVAGNVHGHYRSLLAPALHTVDGDLLGQFFQLEHVQQVQLLQRSLGLDRMVEEWALQSGMSDADRSWMGSSLRGAQTTRMLRSECAVHAHAVQNQVWCRTAGFIGHIISYLQSLDWHQ